MWRDADSDAGGADCESGRSDAGLRSDQCAADGQLQRVRKWAGHNILSGSAELSTAAETNSPVGAYPITVSQGTLIVADTNYSLAFVEGALTVTQAILSVTADNQVRVYGTTNPVFRGTVVGIQNGDAIVASYCTVAETNSPVGDYEICLGCRAKRWVIIW